MLKRILIIAGPNGSGKTTVASTLIRDFPMLYEFLNADEIARGLAPMHPETVALNASKLMIKRLRDLLDSDKSFAFETTGAGTNYLKYLKEAQRKGYIVNLLFLWLPSAEHAIERVTQRVSQGGHYIPPETVKRRYFAGLKNLLKYYLPLADIALILDNAFKDSQKIIAGKNQGQLLEIENKPIWESIEAYGR